MEGGIVRFEWQEWKRGKMVIKMRNIYNKEG